MRSKQKKTSNSRIKRLLKTDWFVPVIIVALLLVISGGIIIVKQQNALQHNSSNGSSEQSFTGYEYDCDDGQPGSIECQQKKYVDLVQDSNIQQTFTQLKQDYQADSSVQTNCHQITHAIGREAAAQYKTIEAAYEQGDNFCWSGFYHGVMEAVANDYGKDRINSGVNTICANIAQTRQYSFYHFNCVHGLGHGLMAVNDNELLDVLVICDNYTDTWEQRSCYGGAFMENIMVAIQTGGQSKYLDSSQPMYPCTAVGDRYKEDCYLMQTSQALRVLANDYVQVFTLCGQSGTYANVCYQSLGRDASGNSTSNIEKTIAVCSLGQSEDAKNNCYIGAVKDFISYYSGDIEAKQLCDALPVAQKNVCHETRESYVKTL